MEAFKLSMWTLQSSYLPAKFCIYLIFCCLYTYCWQAKMGFEQRCFDVAAVL